MINVRPDQFAEIKSTLEQCVPGREVYAFGSRVVATPKLWSDPDLAMTGPEPLGIRKIGQLIEAGQESSLPCRVDFLD